MLALGDEVPDPTEPVEEALSTELTKEDVTLRRSRVLLAGDTGHIPAVVAAVRARGLDCQIAQQQRSADDRAGGRLQRDRAAGRVERTRNLGPQFVGARRRGGRLGAPAMRQRSALRSPTPCCPLRDHPDLVRTRELSIRPPRPRIGRFGDGPTATAPGSPHSILIYAETGAGMSYMAGLMIQQWITTATRSWASISRATTPRWARCTTPSCSGTTSPPAASSGLTSRDTAPRRPAQNAAGSLVAALRRSGLKPSKTSV